ncbi:hypothetical protein CVT25_015679 [Psilocybe cyanescens]|uniref:Uncharacterized protein n=1 Tax=Psilocybe cyanescens TaxID=93625 RepID=A0A409XJP4_PSICY|nr:hypothetical protein CVT25_015679 [Psilocybe cyanescens]
MRATTRTAAEDAYWAGSRWLQYVACAYPVRVWDLDGVEGRRSICGEDEGQIVCVCVSFCPVPSLPQDSRFSSSRASLQEENSGAWFEFPYPNQAARLWNVCVFEVGVQKHIPLILPSAQRLPPKPDFPVLFKTHWALVDGGRMRADSYLLSTVVITERMPAHLRDTLHPPPSLKPHLPSLVQLVLVACNSCVLRSGRRGPI